MISMRKRYKVYIVVAIILISIYFGLTRSNLLDVVTSGKENVVDLSSVNKDFEALTNFTKYGISINASGDMNAVNDLEQILYHEYVIQEAVIDTMGVELEEAVIVSPIVKKKYNLSNQVEAYNVIVPGAISSEVLAAVKALPGYQDFEVSVEEVPFTINVEQQIDNRLRAIEDLNAKRSSSGFYSQTTDINNDINRIQTEIDSLRFEEDRYQQRMLNPALKIVVSNIGSGSVSMTKLVIEFFKNFLISVVGFSLLLLFTYLALAIILRVMSYLGIRTAKSSGSGYGSYYKYNSRSGYGSYGGSYGSYGRRRKVKRVYKNRDESEGGEPEDKKS